MRLVRDQKGGVLVETTVLIPILFLFILGAIDFLFAFYQWNAAAKAVHAGLRIAAVSNPVASGLNALSEDVLSSTVIAGQSPMPAFTVTCDGATASCTCTSGACSSIGAGSYSSAAMSWIVFGRASPPRTSCNPAPSFYQAGMCNFFTPVQPANVRIVYSHSDTDYLGYAGRLGGPVATIQLQLQGLQFQFFFLGGLLNFLPISIPATTSTITSEDLFSAWPQPWPPP